MKGHLRQRGKSGAWYAVFDAGTVNGKRNQKWHRLEAKTKREAEKELTRLLASVDGGTYVEPHRLTVQQFLSDKWVPLVVSKEWAPSTMAKFEGALRKYVFPTIGGVPLQKLNGLHLQELFANMMEGTYGRPLKSQTVRVLHVQLHRAFGQAVAWGLITKNPSDGATVKRGKAAKKKVLTGEETAELIDRFRETDLYIPVLIMVCTGMRRGEVLGLRWCDVDLDNKGLVVQQALSRVKGQVHLREPKTEGSERFVRIPTILVEALRHHRQTQKVRSLDDLICTQADGGPMVPTTFSYYFGKLAASFGFEGITPHAMRHGHASLLADAGIRDKVISDRLGHKETTITKNVYIHAFDAAQQEAANKVDKLLKRKKGAR